MTDITSIIPFGDQEPEMSKLTKQLYCIVQHDNPLKKINFKQFILKLKEYVEIYDFDWTCKHENGRKCYPRYDKKECAKDWLKRYDYRGAYKVYADSVSNDNYDELLRLHRILQDGEVRGFFEEKQNIRNQIHNLDPDDPDYSFELKRLLESYKLCASLVDSELGLDVKKLEVNGNIKSESKIELNRKSKKEMDDEYEAIFKGYFTQDTNGDAPDS